MTSVARPRDSRRPPEGAAACRRRLVAGHAGETPDRGRLYRRTAWRAVVVELLQRQLPAVVAIVPDILKPIPSGPCVNTSALLSPAGSTPGASMVRRIMLVWTSRAPLMITTVGSHSSRSTPYYPAGRIWFRTANGNGTLTSIASAAEAEPAASRIIDARRTGAVFDVYRASPRPEGIGQRQSAGQQDDARALGDLENFANDRRVHARGPARHRERRDDRGIHGWGQYGSSCPGRRVTARRSNPRPPSARWRPGRSA
jgi:hypothetical protein